MTITDTAFLRDTAQTVRIISLLDSLAAAGVTPSSSRALHELAFLANVLAPVFDLVPLNAALLKHKSGPYYPELQNAIDRLVGRGIVHALELRYELDEIEQKYRVVANYRLCRSAAQPAIDRYRTIYQVEALFLDELAMAYSILSDTEQGNVAKNDARYADKSVDINNVIDFGQWVNVEKNFSKNAAMAFAPNRNLVPAERLYLYLDHLQRRSVNG